MSDFEPTASPADKTGDGQPNDDHDPRTVLAPDELKKLHDASPFEKGDLPALILAALTTLLPFALLMFVLIVGLAALLGGLFFR